MREIFTVKRSTVLAFGSELGRWGCQLKEIYELEKMDCFCYCLEVNLWAPEFLTAPGHAEIHRESLKQMQVELILGFTFASPFAGRLAQESVSIPPLTPR